MGESGERTGKRITTGVDGCTLPFGDVDNAVKRGSGLAASNDTAEAGGSGTAPAPT